LTFAPIEFPVEGLVGDGIRLRLRSDADTPALVKACRDPAIQRYTVVPENYEESHALEYARRAASGLAEGTALSLIIGDADSSELLGPVALRRVPADDRVWSVGYWVAPWARRRGVATTAVRLISSFGFDELGAQRIELQVEPENLASNRVAQRAGYVRDPKRREFIEIKGRRHNVFVYTRLPDAPS
jgi:RimJ/RimL family protein N-acetyltransferase